MEKAYIAIDLKSFYASVECVERGLNPLTANLVVADETRTKKTICLAVSPALKALGIPGRARLFEVYRKTKDFIIAPPRMQKYIDISTKIFEIYASYVASEDIHIYSIDEVFMDVTHYLKMYQMTAYELARTIIRKVLDETGVTATVGIGTNLYLAKIAMDIEAKHMPADTDGVRISELDEISYRRLLWDHQPIKDFWRVGPGISRKLSRMGIYTMGDLAKYSLSGSDKLYKEFGINAELLIDHAWGYEPTEISDIKNYRSDNHSVSSGQVLSEPYNIKQARIAILEMSEQLALELEQKQIIADQIVITVGYDISSVKGYAGSIKKDSYGRLVPEPAHGTIGLGFFTNSSEVFMKKTAELFDKISDPNLKVRRMYVVANHARIDKGEKILKQLDMFTDYEAEKQKLTRDKKRQEAIIKIKNKYGKNAILRGIDFEDGATTRKRNAEIGGHRA